MVRESVESVGRNNGTTAFYITGPAESVLEGAHDKIFGFAGAVVQVNVQAMIKVINTEIP